MNTITSEKLAKYFDVTGRAIATVKKLNTKLTDQQADVLDMIERYYADAQHFSKKNDAVNAFAALNYCHGWLDCAARTGLFDVGGDSVLFTVD